MLWVLAALQIWIADESDKVRPDARPPAAAPAPRIRLAAAGGECVGAQLVVRGPALGLTAAARGKARLDLYRVATIVLEHPSGPEGATGEWPDALIPARDAVYGEERSAFPVDVASDRAQAVFVEACVPRGTGPTRLAGSVRLSWRGGSADVPVEVRVRAFDLPATPALATAFGFSGDSAAKGHGRNVDAARELTRAYDLIALRRGITLFGGTQDPPAFSKRGDDVRIDWTSYDAEVAPFLDGTAIPGGARWTAVELREPAGLTRPQQRSWRRQWQDHFRERGWLDRLFRYVEDEPAPAAFPRVEQKARELREDAPDVRRLVTTAWTEALADVNQWTPLLNCVGEKNATCSRAAPRARYDRLWWYQSCMSHGCSVDGKPVLDPAFRGWPTTATCRSARSSATRRSLAPRRGRWRLPCAASPAIRGLTSRCANTWPRASKRCSPCASSGRAEYLLPRPGLVGMLPMLALLLAALCPTQKLPAVRSTALEVLHYRLDALGADVGTFEIRAEPPPASERSRAALRLSSRAKTSAFVSTNLGRFETYATALVARDFTPLHYREDLDENDVHRGVELLFPPLNGTLAVKATKNGEPEPLAVELTDNVRDMISTLYLLRLLPMNQPVCLEVFAGRKVWKLTGQLAAKESIDTPLGH